MDEGESHGILLFIFLNTSTLCEALKIMIFIQLVSIGVPKQVLYVAVYTELHDATNSCPTYEQLSWIYIHNRFLYPNTLEFNFDALKSIQI